MAFEPLRVTRRDKPTLANTLNEHCEDIRVSEFGEARDFILIVDTDRSLRVMTYGFDHDRDIIQRLYEAARLVRGGENGRT